MLCALIPLRAGAETARPVSSEIIDKYTNVLPDALLDIWRREGFRAYPGHGITLTNPDIWEATLTRWLQEADASSVSRTFAISPLGGLFVYRRLGDDSELVFYIDPVTRRAHAVADSFSEFLEHDLADPDALGARVSRDLLGRARELAGPLASGEVYRLDRRLEPLEILRVERQDALLFHKAIRDLADAQEAGILPPQRLNDILPPEYLEILGAGLEGVKAPWGLYLNSHVGFNTLLSLCPEGSYVLLFWDSHAGDFGAFRFYQGNVRLIEGAEGGRIFNLDIPFDDNSLGSDGGFEQLHFVADPAGNWLLQDERLESLADDLNWDGRFGSDNVLFQSAGFDDLLPGHTESVAPPALLALPEKLRAMLRHEPLKARILSIDWDTLDPDYDTVQAVIDLGEEDGAKMNLPFAPDQSIDKDYTGRINDPGPGQSGISLRLMTDGAGEYLYRPDVGDLLAGCKRSTP